MSLFRRSPVVEQRITFDSMADVERAIAEHVAPHLERAYIAGYRAALESIR